MGPLAQFKKNWAIYPKGGQMTNYETVCIFKSDVQGEKLNAIFDKITKVMNDHKIKDVKKNDWGIRKLAYPIEKLTTGHYYCFEYAGQGNIVSELERQLGYEDGILRYMTCKIKKSDKAVDTPQSYIFGRIAPQGSRGRSDRHGQRQDRHDRHDRHDRAVKKEA